MKKLNETVNELFSGINMEIDILQDLFWFHGNNISVLDNVIHKVKNLKIKLIQYIQTNLYEILDKTILILLIKVNKLKLELNNRIILLNKLYN